MYGETKSWQPMGGEKRRQTTMNTMYIIKYDTSRKSIHTFLYRRLIPFILYFYTLLG